MKSLTLKLALFLIVVSTVSVFPAIISCPEKSISEQSPPVAVNDVAFVRTGGVSVPVLANDLVASGGSLALVGVGPCGQANCTAITTARGGQVQIQGSNVFYTPPPTPVVDWFEYTITDTTQIGSSATARVDIFLSGDVNISFTCTDGACSFTAVPAVSTGIKRYLWTFGDGTPAHVWPDRVTHWYTASGTYTVTVIVEYWAGESVTGQTQVTVTFSQNATWRLTTVGLGVVLDNLNGLSSFPVGSKIVVNWSPVAGDCYEGCGPIDDQETNFTWVGSLETCGFTNCRGLGHYKRSGTYQATLRFDAPNNVPKDYKFFVTVENTDPAPEFTFRRPDPNVRKILFELSNAGGDDGPYPLGPFEWDFGDGETYRDQLGQNNPDHTYVSAGTYNVNLKVTDAEGRSGIGTMAVPVTNTPPVPKMTVNCKLFDCAFTSAGSFDDGGPFSAWLWNFGDGTTAPTAEASKTYSTAGCRDVTLQITDADGAASTVQQKVPVGPPLVANAGGVVADAHTQSFQWSSQWGTTDGNLNGILEPGETAVIEPTWQASATTTPVTVTSQGWTSTDWGYATPEFRDFPLSGYDLSTGTADCWSKGRCYVIKLFTSGRNLVGSAHNDISFQEKYTATGLPTPGSPVVVHVGASFNDVPKSHWSYPFVETALHFGIAGACNGQTYCPETKLTRAQIASWLLVAMYGPGYQAPACTAPGPYSDVPCSHAEARSIQQLKADGVIGGTGTFSPDGFLTRAQFTEMLLKARLGASYTPPACNVSFGDVQCPGHPSANWITDARARGISIGCSANEYCPEDIVDRAQAAVLLVRAFDIRIDKTTCPAPQGFDVIPGHVIKLPITSLTFNPSPVLMGTQSTGTIVLAWPTGPATSIPLTIDNPGAATIPATVLVPAGQSTGTFTVTGKTVAVRTPTNISATYFNYTKTTQLDVCTPAPAIATQPASQIINAGQSATLTVAASGGGALTYQWYQGTAPSTATPVGANSPTLTVTPTVTTSYWVRVTNACGSTDSVTATITVCYLPGITAQPLSDIVTPGGSATLSVTATVSGPLSYQWYEGTTGTTTAPVGTSSATFNTPGLTASKSYWVRVTSTCNGVATSDSTTATITVVDKVTRRQMASNIAQSQTSITTNWSRPTRAGTLLVAVFTAADQAAPPFTAPAGWIQAVSNEVSELKGTIYYYPNNPGGRTSETFTTNGWFRDQVLVLMEYVGVVTVNALDKIAADGDNDNNNGNISTGYTPTTTQANELAVGGLASFSVTEFTNPDNAFTEIAERTIGWHLTAEVTERVVNAATQWGHNVTVPATNQWIGMVATFRAAENVIGGCTAPPAITAHPTSRSINSGTTTTLTVAATGGTPSYQWFQGFVGNTTQPVGTGASFTTPALTVTTNYWVRVTNACGVADSAAATVTVCSPLGIATQPASTSIGSGGSATLSVVPSGSGPFTYQWYEGTAGTTTTPVGTSSPTLNTGTLTATKSYWVRVTSTCNGTVSVDSTTATVTVTATSEIIRRQKAAVIGNSQQSITAAWPQATQGGSLLVAVFSAENGTYPVATFIPPAGWQLATMMETTNVKTAIYYYPNNPGGRTSETFGTNGQWRDQILQVAEYTGVVTTSPLDKTAFNGSEATPADGRVDTGYTPTTTQFKELVITGLTHWAFTTFSSPDNSFTEIHDQTIGSFAKLSTAVHERVVNTTSAWGHGATIDSPVTTRAWVAAVATFKAGALDCSAAPTITTQPASSTITSGQTKTLTVVAGGSGTMTYQWYQGTAPSTTTPVGTNSASYTTPGLSATTSYWVKVTNNCGSVNSTTATVTVCNPPAITTQPASSTIAPNATATLTVTATGTAPLSYQWYEGASGVTTTPVGTNSNSFTTPALTATKSYWVKVSNACASVNSNAATVTVSTCTAPGIATQPASQTINSGATATLSVVASGSGPFSYQWYEGVSGTTTTPVGTNSSSYTTPALTATKSYWVKVTSTCSGSTSVNSNTATVTVCMPPAITTQPASQTINSGSTATLTVTATGTAPLSYQWYEGASGVTTTPVGTNSSSFTTPALSATKSYWVKVSNACGSVNSNAATVTVNTCTAPGIATQPASQTINSGATATLSVVASGSGPFSYQWYQGASGTTTTPVGTNSSSFTTPALTATTSYWVKVTSTCSGSTSVNSNTATITVNQPAIARRQIASSVANSQQSIAASWPQPTQAGSLLVAVISAENGAYPIANFAPPAGWQLAVTTEWTKSKVNIYYYPNNPGGRTSETFTNGSLWRDMVLQLAEYTGMATSSVLDKTAINGNDTMPANGSVSTGYTGTQSQAKELIITAVSAHTPTTFSGAGNFFVKTHDHMVGTWAHISTCVHELIVNPQVLVGWGHSVTVDSPVTTEQWVAAVATFKGAN